MSKRATKPAATKPTKPVYQCPKCGASKDKIHVMSKAWFELGDYLGSGRLPRTVELDDGSDVRVICNACGFETESVSGFLQTTFKPVTEPCPECIGGACIMTGNDPIDIQRCDACQALPDDESAAHYIELLATTLHNAAREFPGLIDGETEVNGADLTEFLSRVFNQARGETVMSPKRLSEIETEAECIGFMNQILSERKDKPSRESIKRNCKRLDALRAELRAAIKTAKVSTEL